MTGHMCQALNCRQPATTVPVRLQLAELSGSVPDTELELDLCDFHGQAVQEAAEALLDREADLQAREAALDAREADGAEAVR